MIIGILTGIVIMLVLFLCSFLSYRYGCKPTKTKKKQQDLEELRQLKLREEGFKNIMDYDYKIAIGKR